jgi:DNA-binding winged helix-turn-helix (wHTH) protein
MARFGPYELDVRLGEMRKFGTRLKLGEQPLRILIFLIERQGELVTREELRTRLWSTDTFVDFDHSLNSAVQRLRDSLSDTADKAQWIETIPRRGYRFVGEIEWMKPNGVKPESASRPYAVASSPQSDPALPIRPNSVPDATPPVPASRTRSNFAAAPGRLPWQRCYCFAQRPICTSAGTALSRDRIWPRDTSCWPCCPSRT